MYCKECGKEISDQAKFCNYCGAQVTAAQPKAASAQPAAAQQQPAKPKKKSRKGLVIFIILVILALIGHFAEKYYRGELDLPGSSGVSDNGDVSLLASCNYGALYKDGCLYYGKARLLLDGYVLYGGEDNSSDMLVAPDGSAVVTVNTNFEVNISYDASDADGIRQSYADSGFENVSILEFDKYNVDGYPVISYVAAATVDGVDEYFGELIIMPGKNPSQTMRITMETLAAGGYGNITQVFGTLDISDEYAISAGDTNTIGPGRITVK